MLIDRNGLPAEDVWTYRGADEPVATVARSKDVLPLDAALSDAERSLSEAAIACREAAASLSRYVDGLEADPQIRDPEGKDETTFLSTYRRIDACLDRLAREIAETGPRMQGGERC